MHRNQSLAAAALLLMAMDLWAASMVETRHEEGSDQVFVDGSRMLVKDTGGEGLMVMRSVALDPGAFEVPGDYKVTKMPAMPGAGPGQGASGGLGWGHWQGQDCSGEHDAYPSDDDMDEEYLEEEYTDSEFLDEEYTDEGYDDRADETPGAQPLETAGTEEQPRLEDSVKETFNGLMNRFRKKDQDG